jgi:hypothetical protein
VNWPIGTVVELAMFGASPAAVETYFIQELLSDSQVVLDRPISAETALHLYTANSTVVQAQLIRSSSNAVSLCMTPEASIKSRQSSSGVQV